MPSTAKTQDIHIVEVSDELTIRRKARLIVAGPRDAAEEAGINRATGPGDIAWDEEQTDAQPYEAKLCREPAALRFVQLLWKRQSAGSLNPEDAAAFAAAAKDMEIEDAELLRFERAFPPGPSFAASVAAHSKRSTRQ